MIHRIGAEAPPTRPTTPSVGGNLRGSRSCRLRRHLETTKMAREQDSAILDAVRWSWRTGAELELRPHERLPNPRGRSTVAMAPAYASATTPRRPSGRIVPGA